MVGLRSKLKLTFNPCEIEPTIINLENLGIITDKLKEFDNEYFLMKHSQKSSYTSMLTLTLEFLEGPVWGSSSITMRNSLDDSVWDAHRYPLLNSIWATMSTSLMLNSMWNSMSDEILDQMWDSIRASMWDQMWSSILITISKKEYERLLVYQPELEGLPFKKVKKFCLLYDWFSRRGLFPHRSINKNEYLLGSWKYPKEIQTIYIQ